MNLGFSEMAFLFVLGLLLFGPKKLPEIGRQLGKLMADFRRASNEFQRQLSDEVSALEREIEEDKARETAGNEPKTIAAPSAVRPDFTAARDEFERKEQESATVAAANHTQNGASEAQELLLERDENAISAQKAQNG